ncbi:MAG: DUF5050 domain-containing protein [Lachnospiraceae bacterium]|nr:DUF5050 domain-containing protein [Lachnospiraceae bacterium]
MKIKKILPFIVLAVVIAILVVVRRFAAKASIIPENEVTLQGNTAGNIYNGGKFCETEEGVYFSNAYDGGALYFLGTDGKAKKIAEGNISYINAAGDYLYYYTAETSSGAGLGYVRGGRGIYRIAKKGKNDTILVHGTSDAVLLLGNYIYYTNFGDTDGKNNAVVTLSRISINGEEETKLSENHVLLGAADGINLYYAGVTENHHLYALDSTSGMERDVAPLNAYKPIVQNGLVYYMDISDDYKVKCYHMSDGSVTTIVNERVDTFNMLGDMIYYQNCNPDSYALMRIHTDGSGLEKVYDGVASSIFMTSDYTYFTLFGADIPMYKTPTYGAVQIDTFTEALQAAQESIR